MRKFRLICGRLIIFMATVMIVAMVECIAYTSREIVQAGEKQETVQNKARSRIIIRFDVPEGFTQDTNIVLTFIEEQSGNRFNVTVLGEERFTLLFSIPAGKYVLEQYRFTDEKTEKSGVYEIEMNGSIFVNGQDDYKYEVGRVIKVAMPEKDGTVQEHEINKETEIREFKSNGTENELQSGIIITFALLSLMLVIYRSKITESIGGKRRRYE